MINFEELKIKDSEPLDRNKWNGLLDWVAENPLNLTRGALSLKHFESTLEVRVEAQKDFGLLQTSARPLAINPGGNNVGIGNTNPGRRLEVTGEIVTRVSSSTGAACILGVSSVGAGSLWTNNAYNPAATSSGWMRAITLKDGNVGIGETPTPMYSLSLGAALGRTKLAVYQAADNSSHYGMGVTAGRFFFNIGNPQARFVFLNSAQADAKEVLIIDGNADLHFRNQIKISDRTVKTDIRPFADGLDVVTQLSPVAYHYNGLADTVEGSEDIGLIAQELNAVAPYLVAATRHKLRPADADETEVLSIKPISLVYVLVNAVKDLSRQLQALQQQVGTPASERADAHPIRGAATQP